MTNNLSVKEIALALRRESDVCVLFKMEGQFEWSCRCKFKIDQSHEESKKTRKIFEQISDLRAQVYKKIRTRKLTLKKIRALLEAMKKILFLGYRLLAVWFSPGNFWEHGAFCRLSYSSAVLPLQLSDDDYEYYHAVSNFIDKPSTDAFIRSPEFAAFLERGRWNDEAGGFTPPSDDFDQWWSDGDSFWEKRGLMSPKEKWERSGKRRTDWWFSPEDKKRFKEKSVGRLAEYYKDANGKYSLRNFTIVESGRYGEMTLDLATSEIWEIGELKPDEFSCSFHLGKDEITQEQLREAFHLAEQQEKKYIDDC